MNLEILGSEHIHEHSQHDVVLDVTLDPVSNRYQIYHKNGYLDISRSGIKQPIQNLSDLSKKRLVYIFEGSFK